MSDNKKNEDKNIPFWWKPSKGERYFSFMHDFTIVPFHWQDCTFENQAYSAGNCFQKLQEAQKACHLVKACLYTFHDLVQEKEWK